MSTEKLSIAYVFDGKFTPDEGVPGYIRTLGDYYTDQGHDVSYIVGESDSPDPNIHSVGHTVSVRFNGNRVDVPLPISANRVEGVLEEVNPDILHVQMPYHPLMAARFVNHAAPETGIVGTFHIVPTSLTARVGSYALGLVNNPTQKKFEHSISVSPAAQEFAQSVYGISSEVIAPPIDLEHFKKGSRLPEYDDGKTNIVFMGRLVERKGCQYLINAVNRLDKRVKPQVRLLIAGKGPLLDDLEALTSELGLDNMVSFLGFVEDDNKPDLLASADIAVFPSTGGESFGIVLAEAMASKSGVVIGGNNKGYRGVLNDRPELLFNPLDQKEFTRKLSELISNPDKRDQLHDYQQELVKQYDISVVGPRILKIYQWVLKDKSTRK
jgi:phosphatidylinositol alpha-mannosyltransferase